MVAWLTNDPEVAAQLNAADKVYDAAREASKYLPLAGKIEALRKAKEARQSAYDVVMPSLRQSTVTGFLRTALSGKD